MKLVVTRPEPAAGETARKLRALGYEVVVSPMLEIVDTAAIQPKGDFSSIVVTSSNALIVLAQYDIDNVLTKTPIFVVGDQTASKAREIGFANIQSASGDASDLIDLLEKQQGFLSAAENTTLYICGANSTHGFVEKLQKSGLNIVQWVNYKANLVDQLTNKTEDFLRSGNQVGILLYSARTAQQFSRLILRLNMGQFIDNIKFFALSERVRQSLDTGLQIQCSIASNPTESSLFQLI